MKELKLNQTVRRGKDWRYQEQDKDSAFGVITEVKYYDDEQETCRWYQVRWLDKEMRTISVNSYRYGTSLEEIISAGRAPEDLQIGDTIVPVSPQSHPEIHVNKLCGVARIVSRMTDGFVLEIVNQSKEPIQWACDFDSFFIVPRKEQPPVPKQEDKPTRQQSKPDSMDTSQMGFQVMIPEKAIQERIDKLVMFKLRHEKIQGLLGSVINEQKTQVVNDLKQHVYETMKDDFLGVKQRVIDDYILSKRTQIFLEKKVLAEVTDEMPHEKLNDVLTFLTLFKQAMIVGPTGSGKSTLAKQAADAFKLRFGSFSCNMEASKSELVGFANLNGYITPQFLDFYENGGVFLIDEYDAMSANIAVVLNAAFDRTGQISVPNRMEKPIAKKHENFYCILAGNTWGSGSVEFQGREMQDMAFLDRFKLCRVFIDYDTKIEKGIAGEHYTWFKNIRAFFHSYVDSEQFSTRSIYDASMLLANNFGKRRILEMISSHWDKELQDKLISKVGA